MSLKKKKILIGVTSLLMIMMFSKGLTMIGANENSNQLDSKETINIEQKIEKIDNFTIKEYMKFFNDSKENPETFYMFQNLPDTQRIVVIGETPKGKAPIFGSSRKGEEGITGCLTVDGKPQYYSTSDPKQSATISDIIQAWKELNP